MDGIKNRFSSLGGIIDKIKNVVVRAIDAATPLDGWKGIMARSSLIIVFAYIQEKFKKLFMEPAEDFAKENIKLLQQFLVEKFNLESLYKMVMSKLGDVKTYLGWIGPLVGGIAFAAQAMGTITRQFIEDYNELMSG